MWSTAITKLLSADEKTPIAFTLSEGQRHDAPQGRKLLETCGNVKELLEKYGKDQGADIVLFGYELKTLTALENIPCGEDDPIGISAYGFPVLIRDNEHLLQILGVEEQLTMEDCEENE